MAIQDAFGWLDYHLHHFEMMNPFADEPIRFGIPDDWEELDLEAGWDYKIREYFSKENPNSLYVYDYGDNWEHEVQLEEILPTVKGEKYPKCLDGKRACPPEDCGGVWGYEEFLKAIRNPRHPEHENFLEWIGGTFDPEYFAVAKVKFHSPKKRWERAMGWR